MRTRKRLGEVPEPPATNGTTRSTRKRALPADEPAGLEVRDAPKRRRSSRFTEQLDEAEVEAELPDENAQALPNDEYEPADQDAQDVDIEDATPDDAEEEAIQTPGRRKPGRPPKTQSESRSVTNGVGRGGATAPSKSRGGAAVAAGRKTRTPVKAANGTNGVDTPRRRDLADRSARRKSARMLIDRVVAGTTSDDDVVDEGLARAIYESSEEDEDEEAAAEERTGAELEEDEDGEDGDEAAIGSTIVTANASPAKRGRGGGRGRGGRGGRGRGRGGGAGVGRRKRSPTPPRDLPAHEQYFFQNKPGMAHQKTSGNKLSSIGLELLTHEEYFTLLRAHHNHHSDEIAALQAQYVECFPQWTLELTQGFGLCLYGYGSKRDLLRQFATMLFHHDRENRDSNSSKIVVVNGYVRSTNIVREILTTVGRAAVGPDYKPPASTNAVAAVQSLGAHLATSGTTVTIVVNSIDAPPMRRGIAAAATTSSTSTTAASSTAVTAQAILAQLASFRPHVRLVCSADTPDFPLMWDASLRSQFDFVFHDCTTFAPFSAAEMDVVDDVHELLGRKARRAGGKEGVVFVLRSLPENAKSLFRLLVTEVLVAMDEDVGGGGVGVGVGAENPGVEYRMLYNKAVEEFICSSEMAFRTLLKEFHDHQIITSRKDAIGTELLCVPFRKEELEGILEDLMS